MYNLIPSVVSNYYIYVSAWFVNYYAFNFVYFFINEGHCYGCTRNGNINMKHPSCADEYIGGHLHRDMPLRCYSEWSDSDDDV